MSRPEQQGADRGGGAPGVAVSRTDVGPVLVPPVA